MSSGGRIALYLFGMLLVIGGLAYAAFLMGVPTLWIGIGALVALGVGIAGAASRTAAPSDRTEVHHRGPS